MPQDSPCLLDRVMQCLAVRCKFESHEEASPPMKEKMIDYLIDHFDFEKSDAKRKLIWGIIESTIDSEIEKISEESEAIDVENVVDDIIFSIQSINNKNGFLYCWPRSVDMSLDTSYGGSGNSLISAGDLADNRGTYFFDLENSEDKREKGMVNYLLNIF